LLRFIRHVPACPIATHRGEVVHKVTMAATSKAILVTGGNDGIGFALCKQIAELGHRVILASRNPEKGAAAVKQIAAAVPQAAVESIVLDVEQDASVRSAADSLAGQKLFAIVNNAGIMGRGNVINTNLYGTLRVCKTFMPLLSDDGRVVNVSSASGPMFLAQAASQVVSVLTSPHVTWEQIEMQAQQLGGRGDDYGLSKACINAYTMLLAREFPKYRINACTPGYIATKMTGGPGGSKKSPGEGTLAIKYLLFGEPPANGRYYGSDGVRSPLDRYRGPGEPPYEGL